VQRGQDSFLFTPGFAWLATGTVSRQPCQSAAAKPCQSAGYKARHHAWPRRLTSLVRPTGPTRLGRSSPSLFDRRRPISSPEHCGRHGKPVQLFPGAQSTFSARSDAYLVFCAAWTPSDDDGDATVPHKSLLRPLASRSEPSKLAIKQKETSECNKHSFFLCAPGKGTKLTFFALLLPLL
jgi:hypothetical protein